MPFFIKASDSLGKIQNDKTGKVKGLTFTQVREKLYKNQELHFLSKKEDSVFVVEAFDIESGTYIGKMWNQTDTVIYKYSGDFSFPKYEPFTRNTINYVSRWDTVSLKAESKKYAIQNPGRKIYASKIIRHGTSFITETTSFDEFINLKNDTYDF